MKFHVRYRIYQIRHWLTETLPWKVAMLLPHKVALFAFVRVYAVTGELGPDYEPTYRAWEARSK
jgi:hypothetical protein